MSNGMKLSGDNTMRKFILTLMFLILAAGSLWPQFAEGRGHRTIIRAGRLFDSKSGKMLTNQTIIVEGGNIVSVSDAAAAVQSGDTVIDLSKSTVLPGLMDAHTHITSNTIFGYAE